MLPFWGVWDREFVTKKEEDGWSAEDILAPVAS
jgi:hypothetical protein